MKKIIIVLALSFCFSLDKTLDLAETGMLYSEKGSEIVMENVANAKTPGFREVKQKAVFDQNTNTILNIISNSFVKGPYVSTGRSLDLAIDGKGFFMVLDKDSNTIYYTCDGRFEINADRKLVTLSKKFLVLDVDRAPIEIPQFSNVKVDSKGQVFDESSNLIAQVGVVDIDNYRLFNSINNVFFTLEPANSKTVRLVSDEISMKQGYYEGSNVDYSRVLSKMAQQGKYSANTNMVQTRMKMLDTVIDIANKQ